MAQKALRDIQKLSFRVDGMFCVNCQNIIEKGLKKTAGVHKAKVNYRTGYAVVSYDETITGFDKIASVIEELGYRALDGREKAAPKSETIPRIAGTLVIIIALFMLMRAFTKSGLAAAFPLAKEGMSYAMLLVIGLLTSVHCIAMCGGINLSQTLNADSPLPTPHSLFPAFLLPSVLYNGGRLVSYTLVGVLVGALGSVITLSGRFQGAVQLIAGIFMVIMGINMLGLFPALRRFIPQLPKIFAAKNNEQKNTRSPPVVGFLNGFMPCGPLQAMQVYALSTGSPLRGGISMFLFCLGTIPLMFALGAASSAFSGALSGAKGRAFSRRVTRIGAVLVASLGLVMFSNGWNLSAPVTVVQERKQTQPAPNAAPESKPFAPVIEDGAQIVNSTLRPNRYPAITVRQGVPVRWTINAPSGSITGCNYTVILYEYGIEHEFKHGDNVIEFTPEKTGRFRYSCWMGMIRSTITVVAETEKEG